MTRPILIDRPNLSLAWADAFTTLRTTPGRRLSPLTLSFEGFADGEVVEIAAIKYSVDAALVASDMQRVQTVANTIFPQALWREAKGDRQALYANYLENLPEYVAMSGQNRRGLYFGRLIAYYQDPKTGERLQHVPEKTVPQNGNQLEFIIEHCRPGFRVSALQASVFDPARDHTNAAQVGFPCLQHVTFVPDFAERTLRLNAFYATQQLFERGYGNYLGLARLGLFVGSQTGLALNRVTCFVGVEKIDSESTPKQGPELQELIKVCSAEVQRDTLVAGDAS